MQPPAKRNSSSERLFGSFDLKLISWTLILCSGASFWFYLGLERGPMNYPRFPSFWNTGKLVANEAGVASYTEARNLLNISRIILQPMEYVNATNSAQRLNHMLYVSNFETPYMIDQEYSLRQSHTSENLILNHQVNNDNYQQDFNTLSRELDDEEPILWPQANQTLCARQLDWLTSQLSSGSTNNSDDESNYDLVYGKRGLQLTEFVDSFGKLDSGLYGGNTFWPGSYLDCTNLKLELNNEEAAQLTNNDGVGNMMRMRYCIGRFRHSGWQQSQENTSDRGNTAVDEAKLPHIPARIRVGMCLPEACSSRSFRQPQLGNMEPSGQQQQEARKRQQLEGLAKLEMSIHMKRSLQMTSLACLPDESSPVRQLPPSGRLLLALTGLWLAVMILITLVYEFHLRPKYLKQHTYITTNSRNDHDDHDDDYKLEQAGVRLESPHLNQQQRQDNNQFKINITNGANNNNNEMQHKLARNPNLKDHHDQSEVGLVSHSNSNSRRPEAGSQARRLSSKELEAESHPQPRSFGSWIHIFEGLSLRQSIKSFKENAFRVRHARGERVRVNLAPLDFLKIMMAVLVVLTHSGLIVVFYIRKIRNKFDLIQGETSRVGMSMARCVDMYFVLFGLLTTFTILRKLKPQQLANPVYWLALNVTVCFRLTPLFMLVYWFSRSVAPYLGAGPWWDYGLQSLSMKGLCMREPWWASIPYFGNLSSPPVPTCLLPGWFIVSYMQISLIIPLLTYILYALGTKGLGHVLRFGLVVFLCFLSSASLSIKMLQQTAIEPEGVVLFGPLAFDVMEKYEVSGQLTAIGRLASVAVGCLLGYYLHAYETKQIKQWPRWLTHKLTFCASFIMTISIILLPIIGFYIAQLSGHLPSKHDLAFNTGLQAFLWPWFPAVIILNASTQWNRSVVFRFMGHSFWHAFNRLGLMIFLIHWEILMYMVTSFEQGPAFGFVADIVKLWSFGLFASIVLAFALYLIIEAPLARLSILAMRPWIKRGSNNDK